MMYNYPFWGFPSFRRNYYYQRPNYYTSNYYKLNNNISKPSNNFQNSTNTSVNNTSNSFNKNINNHSSCNTKKESTFSPHLQTESKKVDFSCDDNYYSDTEYFNILGFSLHIDDLLILALLFFLYQEGIDDIYLYISLVLLLLS